MRVKKDTIIRTVILIIALVNQLLCIAGRSMLPISDEDINNLISTVFTIAVSLVNWWKNNSFTHNALVADQFLNDLNRKQIGG